MDVARGRRTGRPRPGHARRGLQELREQDPSLVWGDVDAGTGEELWWLLPRGLNELDRLEAGERQ